MKNYSNLLIASLFAVALAACAHTGNDAAIAKSEATQKSYTEYGASIDATGAKTLASLVPLEQQPTKDAIKVSGRIGQVCQKEGCWMMLTDGDVAVRVKFGDHLFTIPKDSQGNAIVRGKFDIIALSLEQAKHMAEDAGQDPNKVTEPQKEVRFIADALLIEKA